MSLRTLFNTQQKVSFGGDIIINERDLYVNGDLTINGTINGTATPANADNTWTGTNDFSICPLSEYDATLATEVFNFDEMNTYFVANSAIKATNTWSGVEAFTQTPTCPLDPVNPTEAVRGAYLKTQVDSQAVDYTTANNAWTGVNTFENTPTIRTPLTGVEAGNKSYCDSTLISGAVSKSSSEAGTGSVVKLDTDYPANTKVITTQLIGGGGGSTSSVGTCECSSAGVSGGAGATGTFICLVDSSTTPFELSWNSGSGGGAGTGCGEGSNGKQGGGSTFNAYMGTGAPDCPAALTTGFAAGGGGGFGGSCGQAGNANGGVINLKNTGGLATGGIQSLFTSFIGRKGTQCLGSNPNFAGIKDAPTNIAYGQGGNGQKCSTGEAGKVGGYGTISYTS